ncbi:matrixin family metalloprotease [Candidatus Pacearchaeota archaeon]|nr:matrixin family metalloprotease [Candidatus Pacearchaeota archaeon]
MAKVIITIILGILVLITLFFAYMTYLNFFSTPVNFEINYKNETKIINIQPTEQFYSNMRFPDSIISYKIYADCEKIKRNAITDAFKIISQKVNLTFYESDAPEINISCSEEYKKEEYFVAGEGGPSKILDSGIFNVILEGKIILLYSGECPSNVALHELLHVLGFNHSSDKYNIMYPITACNQKISDDTVNELKRLYSLPSLPDLYFENVTASKKGIYLNINFIIKNQGLRNSQDTKVILYADNKEIKTNWENKMGKEITIASGKIISAENIRIPYGTKTIKLVVLDGEEINTDNNQIILALSS